MVAVGDEVDRFKVGDRVSPVVFTGHHHVRATSSQCSRCSSQQEEDPPVSSFALSLGGGIDGLASEYFLCDQVSCSVQLGRIAQPAHARPKRCSSRNITRTSKAPR